MNDDLTGLIQIKDFREELAKKLAENNGSLSVAMLDIDQFKMVNDTYGHDVGDLVLLDVVKHFSGNLPDDASFYRNGGDEFVALMPGREKEEAFLLFERIRSSYASEKVIGEARFTQTVSIGIATYPEDGSTLPELLRKGDDAMYRAKILGRNKVCLAREEKKVTKTTHYTQGQLDRLGQLSKKEGIGEAELLREALDDILKKYSN